MSTNRILAIDVGGGTQDILLYESDTPPENCIKLILPAQTQVVAKRISSVTGSGKAVFLTGNLMGGGACVRAIKNHIQIGLDVYATELAAKTIKDNLAEVEEMGIQIVTEPPEDAVSVELRDIDTIAIEKALAYFETEIPKNFSVAVQDHGECVDDSNRKFRFQHWQRFLENDGYLSHLAYQTPPNYLTRMRAVKRDVPDAIVMDTCAAAIIGAFSDPVVAKEDGKGVIIVNMGNQHTLGALVKEGRIWGLFEHHTQLMNPKKLKDYIDRILKGSLSNDEVYKDGGHGCFVRPDFSPEGGFQMVSITGPRRNMGEGMGYHFAVPHGDMMLTGCFGLINAAKNLFENKGESS